MFYLKRTQSHTYVCPSHPVKSQFSLLTNLTGTDPGPNVRNTFASIILSFHSSPVSPGFIDDGAGSTRQSRRRRVRKQTASIAANFLPMHARGPIAQLVVSMKFNLKSGDRDRGSTLPIGMASIEERQSVTDRY